jgi:hypothetical protein
MNKCEIQKSTNFYVCETDFSNYYDYRIVIDSLLLLNDLKAPGPIFQFYTIQKSGCGDKFVHEFDSQFGIYCNEQGK